MTAGPGSARARHDAVALQPGARFRLNAVPGDLDAPVQERQRRGGEPCRNRVHRTGEAAPVTGESFGPDHRHDVLRGLQVAVIGEEDQVTGGQVPIGGGQYGDVDHTLLKRGDTLLLGVERQEPGEPQSVDAPQAGQAGGPGRAFRGTAKCEAASGTPQLAHGVQAQPGCSGAGDHLSVLILCRSRGQCLDTPGGQRAGQCHPHQRGIRHHDARMWLDAGQRGPEIFGNHVHQALLKCRLNELTRAEIEREPYRDPGVPDGKPVDRRQQFAFWEVERGHHDRVGTHAATLPGRCRAGVTGGEQEEQGKAGQSGRRAPAQAWPAGCPALGHGVTFPAAPVCRHRALPATTAVPR